MKKFTGFLALLLAAMWPAFLQAQVFQTLSGPNRMEIDVLAVTPNGMLLTGRDTTIYRSDDQGKTWDRLPIWDQLTDQKWPSSILNGPGNSVYIAASNSLYLYDPILEQLTLIKKFAKAILQLDISPAGGLYALVDPGIWHYSLDGGSTWGNAPFLDVFLPTGMAMLGDSFNFVWNAAKLIRIRADGSQPQVYTIWSGKDLQFQLLPGERLLRLRDRSLSLSYDMGESWTDISGPLAGKEVHLLHKGLDGRFYVVGNQQIWMLNPSTDIWEMVATLPKWPELNYDFYYNESFKLRVGLNDFALFSYGGPCTNRFFEKTTDAGQNWRSVWSNLAKPTVEAIRKSQSGILYAKSCKEWQWSADEGDTWETLQEAPWMDHLYDLKIAADGRLYARVTGNEIFSNDTIAWSDDNGLNWNFFAGSTALAFDIAPDGTLFYCYDGQCYRSPDGGQTQIPLPTIGANAYPESFRFHPDGTVFYFEGPKIWRSEDQGDSWTFHSLDSLGIVGNYHFSKDGNIYFISYQNPTQPYFLFHVTKDQFQTVELMPKMPVINPFESLSYGDYPGIYVTDAAGNLFGMRHRLMKSTNAGQDWTLFNDGLPELDSLQASAARCLYVSPDNYLYIGFANNQIHRTVLPTAVPTAEPVPKAGIQVRVFPNPFSDYTTFELISSGATKPHRLEVFAVNGSVVHTSTFAGNRYILADKSLSPGFYYYRIFDLDGRNSFSGKLIRGR